MILDGHDPAAVAQAADILAAGGLLGMPTETVYGLAADATSAAAVAAIFAAKGRPSDHPLIVHVAPAGPGQAMPPGVDHFAVDVPAFAQRLIAACWPGPLTLILPRRPGVATASAGGHATIGLRCPSHPVAQALLAACAARGVAGVSAPSANQFGRVSPTTAAHVAAEFDAGLAVLDGGPCAVGIESTIVDCSRGVPVLLRPGAVTRTQVEAACGLALAEPGTLDAPSPQASGTLEAHYAPRAKVRLMGAKALQTGLDLLGAEAAHLAVYARAEVVPRSSKVVVRRMPDDAEAAAQQLFAALRTFDAQGVRLIWIETPPDTPAWEGVHDRLRRAAAA